MKIAIPTNLRRPAIRRLLHQPFFIRLFNWEFWNFHVVYAPIYVFWLWLAIRARSFFFFSASNPGIRYGGFIGESKKEVARLIPDDLHPATLFVSIPADPEVIGHQLEGFTFPLIGKPDVGSRGRGILLLSDWDAVRKYVLNAPSSFHIQQYVPYPLEAGIFYYRYPGDEHGRISGIVRKILLQVEGDGHSSILDLIRKHKRAMLQLPNLRVIHGAQFERILPEGEVFILAPYGNHSRGALFLDESHLADAQLTGMIDGICRRMPGFYFGRLDIRYRSWEELKQGTAFSVIEVNGAGSEPAHIYDPGHSIFFAWKVIVRHLVILYRISLRNHRLGVPYLSLREGLRMFRFNRTQTTAWTGNGPHKR